MKNIFKLMAVAMIAVSLPTFTACGDDENTDSPDNPNGGQSSYTVSFNSNPWTAAGDVYAYDFTSEGYLTFYAYSDATESANQTAYNACQHPMVFGFLESRVCSGETYESTNGDCMKYYDATQTYTSDGSDGVDPGTYYRYNAIPESFTENVTAIDLTALTISANWNEQCFDIEEYIANQGTSYGNTLPLTGNMSNLHWVMLQPTK